MGLKSKKAFVVLFFTLFFYDVCSYIEVFVKNKDVAWDSFYIYKGMINGENIYHLSIIFLVFISLIYFLKNFFKE